MLHAHYMEGGLEAGCDEAGRGCLAGPVFAAAVVLPPAADFPGLRDSKKLSETERDILRHHIEREALAWAVGRVEPQEIDTINILQASFLAMHRALDQLGKTPDRILVDGNRFVPYREVPHHTFVKGDDRFLSIAAASVLAKTHRDACMVELGETFPHYGWLRNKGYPTVTHRRAILEHGPCCHHRMSFRLLPADEAHEELANQPDRLSRL